MSPAGTGLDCPSLGHSYLSHGLGGVTFGFRLENCEGTDPRATLSYAMPIFMIKVGVGALLGHFNPSTKGSSFSAPPPFEEPIPPNLLEKAPTDPIAPHRTPLGCFPGKLQILGHRLGPQRF